MFDTELNKFITVFIALLILFFVGTSASPEIKSKEQRTVEERLKYTCMRGFSLYFEDYCDDVVKDLLEQEDLGDILNAYHNRPYSYKGRTFFWND